MKKPLTLLLLLAMLASLAACAKPADTKADAPAVTASETLAETESQELRPNLPEQDYEDYAFTFLNGNTATWMTVFVVTSDAENGETVNDAIYRRNLATEEKFGVTVNEVSTTSVAADTRKAVSSGDVSYDVALMTMGDAFALTLENAAVEYAKIPYIDTEKPWWVKNSMTDMSIANRVYFGISLFDTSHYDGVRSLFFNKPMITDYSLTSPYEYVEKDEWTVENFLSLGVAVGKDLDGDGQWGADDQYGYTTWYSIGGQTLMTGMNGKLSMSKDEDDLPYFALNSEYYIERLEKLTDIFNGHDGFNNPKGDSSNNGGVEAFKAGRVFYYNECLGNAQKLRTMDLDFGIIPAPKYNEAQESYYNLGGNPYFMLVPVTNADLERTGVILESLAYESMSTVSTAFYDIMLNGKVTRDDTSGEMLDIVFSTLSYWHPVASSYVNDTLIKRAWDNKTDFASYFTSVEKKIQSEIDKAVETYHENLE